MRVADLDGETGAWGMRNAEFGMRNGKPLDGYDAAGCCWEGPFRSQPRRTPGVWKHVLRIPENVAIFSGTRGPVCLQQRSGLDVGPTTSNRAACASRHPGVRRTLTFVGGPPPRRFSTRRILLRLHGKSGNENRDWIATRLGMHPARAEMCPLPGILSGDVLY